MTIALWCILIGGLMPFIWTITAKIGGKNKMTMAHNKDPRAFMATLTGVQARANAAQLNAFEALPFFAAAVIVAHITGADQATANMLAAAWVVLRLAHGITYLADLDKIRSLVWFAGLGCSVALFAISA